MFKFFRDIKRGAGYLEGYGDHPGTDFLIVFVLMGGIAGIQRGGIWGFIGGCLVMLLGMGPLWIAGCVSRVRSWDQSSYNTERVN